MLLRSSSPTAAPYGPRAGQTGRRAPFTPLALLSWHDPHCIVIPHVVTHWQSWWHHQQPSLGCAFAVYYNEMSLVALSSLLYSDQ
jgi:hypothetical protein